MESNYLKYATQSQIQQQTHRRLQHKRRVNHFSIGILQSGRETPSPASSNYTFKHTATRTDTSTHQTSTHETCANKNKNQHNPRSTAQSIPCFVWWESNVAVSGTEHYSLGQPHIFVRFCVHFSHIYYFRL